MVTITFLGLKGKRTVRKCIYIAHLLRWHIEAPLQAYSERSGTVRVYLGSHSVTCHPHTFIGNGMGRTWELGPSLETN